jgi:hypothetical protein
MSLCFLPLYDLSRSFLFISQRLRSFLRRLLLALQFEFVKKLLLLLLSLGFFFGLNFKKIALMIFSMSVLNAKSFGAKLAGCNGFFRTMN